MLVGGLPVALTVYVHHRISFTFRPIHSFSLRIALIQKRFCVFLFDRVMRVGVVIGRIVNFNDIDSYRHFLYPWVFEAFEIDLRFACLLENEYKAKADKFNA